MRLLSALSISMVEPQEKESITNNQKKAGEAEPLHRGFSPGNSRAARQWRNDEIHLRRQPHAGRLDRLALAGNQAGVFPTYSTRAGSAIRSHA